VNYQAPEILSDFATETSSTEQYAAVQCGNFVSSFCCFDFTPYMYTIADLNENDGVQLAASNHAVSS